jgi:hypothetical protein
MTPISSCVTGGLLPGKPSGIASTSALDKPIAENSSIAVPKEWKEGTDYL